MWQYWNQNSFGCTLTQMVCTEETAKKELWLQYQKGTSGEGVAGMGASLVVQCLRLHGPNTGGPGAIPGWGTRDHMLQLKIPHAKAKTQHSLKRNNMCVCVCVCVCVCKYMYVYMCVYVYKASKP